MPTRQGPAAPSRGEEIHQAMVKSGRSDKTTPDGQTRGVLGMRRDVLLLLILGLLVPLGYVLSTRHVWEDYFITFRHSQNFVEGNGLVYTPGEPVHGFTSPLGVLLPALFYALTGRGSYEPALWLFRAASLLAFVGGGLLVLRRLTRHPATALMGYAFVLLYLADVKAVAFSMNGMETGFMLLFVGWCVFLWGSLHRRAWLARGLAWGGLMWTRPDGCIYIVALSLAELVFYASQRRSLSSGGIEFLPRPQPPSPLRGRGEQLVSLARSGLVAIGVYLPWFLFALSYYGSPIPQTILAKAPMGSENMVGRLLGMIYARLPHRAACIFGPIYWPLFWPEPAWTYWFCYAVGVFCLVYWLMPVEDCLGRTASLAFVLLCAYLSYVEVQFPWYCPPAALCGLVVLARGLITLAGAALHDWSERPPTARAIGSLAGLALVPVLAGELGIFAMTIRQVKVQQAVIETGHRAAIGRWLKERVQPDDEVYLEPLGYIGYYSGAHMLDWPGLVSPRVSALKRQGLGHKDAIDRLRPAWVVLRPGEAALVYQTDSIFRRDYLPIKFFDAMPRLEEIKRESGPIPGGDYLSYDARFLVFKRKDSPGEKAPPDLRDDAERCWRFLERTLRSRPG